MDSLTTAYNYERYGTPFRRGNTWYYGHNAGLKPQNVIYSIKGDQIDTKKQGTVFFDPNELSDDGTLSVRLHPRHADV
jgi:prolyl oligopeptidase